MFPTQTSATCESTLSYLKKSSIDNENGILFGIFNNNNNFIGHIGIVDIKEGQFELAHLIRGVNAGDPKLIFYAEINLVDWCFSKLGGNHAVVEVMSYNWIVSMMHKEIGFEILNCHPLNKIENEFGIIHKIVSNEEANVKYSIVKMVLNRSKFYECVPWISKII